MKKRKVQRKQRVVMRQKVHEAHWTGFFEQIVSTFKILFWFCLIGGFVGGGYYALFYSDFFMVKSIKVLPDSGRISSILLRELQQFEGLSIFHVSPKKLKKQFESDFPRGMNWQIIRSFPDTLEARYTLRTPIAIWHDSKLHHAGKRVIDKTGFSFILSPSEVNQYHLPKIEVDAPELLFTVSAFLDRWNQEMSLEVASLQDLLIEKVVLDEWEELTLYLEDTRTGWKNMRVVWGTHTPETFVNKIQSLSIVWADLRKKEMETEYINLRDMPREQLVSIGDQQVIGRVIVRPKVKIKGEE